MKLLITGGGGFVGTRLARALLARGHWAASASRPGAGRSGGAAADLLADARVESRVGPLLAQCAALGDERLRRRVPPRLGRLRRMRGRLRARPALQSRQHAGAARRAARSGAGGPQVGPAGVLEFGRGVRPGRRRAAARLVADDTLPAPQTSYGTQKLICEHLVADYTRKGYIDGRAARLMTVTVRPGRPNGAASSFFSGIIREPLGGRRIDLPGRRRRVAPGVVAGAHGRGPDRVSSRRAVTHCAAALALNLPALNVRVSDMLEALEAVAGRAVRERVRFVRD